MEKFSVLEMGSHTFRAMVCEGENNSFRVILRERRYVGLGNEIDQEGFLTDEGVQKALATLEDLLKSSSLMGAQRHILIATGVIRSIRNRESLLRAINERTDLLPRVLSGEEEAELSLLGASFVLKKESEILVFDIGGGSTELGIKSSHGSLFYSLPLGCLLILREFLGCEREETLWEKMRSKIKRELKERLKSLFPVPPLTLIGTGGTMVSLAALLKGIPLKDVDPEKINGTSLTVDELFRIKELLFGLPLEERARLPGLDRERAGPIMVGLGILLEIMEYFKRENCVVSFGDLMEGVALKYIGEG